MPQLIFNLFHEQLKFQWQSIVYNRDSLPGDPLVSIDQIAHTFNAIDLVPEEVADDNDGPGFGAKKARSLHLHEQLG